MRKDARTAAPIEVLRLAGYHNSSFKSLKYFNSDRYASLAPDFTILNGKGVMKEGTQPKMYGIELETECTTVNDGDVFCNILHTIFDQCFVDDLFRIERDGSLGGHGATGAECVSQTFSKAFMRNNYQNIKNMYRLFDAFGITTQNNNCGMHVSISLSCLGSDKETQIENAKKLYYTINRHYDFFKVAFNRVNRTTYCGICDDYNIIKDYTVDQLYNMPNDHMVCMNYSHIHTGRLEIRLVGGQKNAACFRNTMETVFHVVEAMNKLKWEDLDNLETIFKGCNNHVYDRLTRCRNEYVLSQAVLDMIEPTIKIVDWD